MFTQAAGMNGNGTPTLRPSGWTGAVLSTLPPAFLALAALNAAMLWIVLQAVENQSEQRLQILKSVIEKCLTK
jgi:hypothetical protein